MASDEEVFLTCEVCELPFTGIKPFQQHMKGKKHKKEVEDKKIQVTALDGDSGIEETKDSDAPNFKCDVCDIVLSGIIPYTQHLKSKPHSKALRRKNDEDGPGHLVDAGNDSELPDNDVDLIDMLKKIGLGPFGSCSICEKQFGSAKSYSQHMRSKSHSKRSLELQLLKKIKTVLLGTRKVNELEEMVEDKNKGEVIEDSSEGQEELKCKDCDKIFSGAISLAQHLISKTHMKRGNKKNLMDELKAIKTAQLEDYSSLTEGQDSSEWLICDVCFMTFASPEDLKDHLKSKKHEKAMRWKKFLSKIDKSNETGGKAETRSEGKEDTEKSFTEKKGDER